MRGGKEAAAWAKIQEVISWQSRGWEDGSRYFLKENRELVRVLKWRSDMIRSRFLKDSSCGNVGNGL